MSLKVLYEDNHLIAVQKNPSDIVQGDKTGDAPLGEKVGEYLKTKYNKAGNVFVGVIHRIDRPVSGVVVFARTSKALARMNKAFQDKTIQKTYLALVENKPKEEAGTLTHYLKKNQQQNKSYASLTEKEDYKKSVLSYKWIASGENYHLLEIKPKTGRHHQIRVQLSEMGCIIKGDLKYGAKRSNKDASICLHAYAIEFEHPVKKEPIRIVCPLPNTDIWSNFDPFLQ